ncbi:hypothetical protein NC652_038021 [Populus alba x Populus x berolinensis]|nr:hypothetical protein NC652_038021 [Populus alba x Populus x berolinensis]
MAVPPRWIFLLPVLAILLLSSSIKAYGLALDKEEKEFHEELLLKPLPDRKVLAHFHFQTRAPSSTSNGHHHHLFYFADCNNANLPGVELLAVFNVPKEEVDASWKNLTHTLSGLFCASINFLESSTMYSAPCWSFRQASGSLRYGMLPREAVCTENLTPWLKLLPCRDKVGLSALMDRPSIYKSFYHSQRLHLTSNAYDPEGMNSGIVLEQTLTVVLRPSSQRASSTDASESYLQPSCFDLSVNPDRVLKEEKRRHGIDSSFLYEFSVEKYNSSKPFDLGLTWKSPIMWSSRQAPLHASRFFMGSENERGAIAILLKSTDELDAVPWMLKVLVMDLFVDDQPKIVGAFMKKMHVFPSKDKISPGMMVMVLKLPCGVKSAALILEFDKVGLALHCFLV